MGSGFGDVASNDVDVTVGGVSADVITFNDTVIETVLPSMGHGSYVLMVKVSGQGYADTRYLSLSIGGGGE